jgi:E3 ubiquitin-protein ligase SHPRH
MARSYRLFDTKKISKKRISSLEGLQRRLIALFTPTLVDQPLCDSEHDTRGDTIYYSSTLPALLQGVTYELFQPEGLLPVLLPFEWRGLQWMLLPERNTVTRKAVSCPTLLPSPGPFCLHLGDNILSRPESTFQYLDDVVGPSPVEGNTGLGGILTGESGTSQYH